jgi:hypothetical protein
MSFSRLLTSLSPLAAYRRSGAAQRLLALSPPRASFDSVLQLAGGSLSASLYLSHVFASKIAPPTHIELSTVLNSGRGLFASQSIAIGSVISIYPGLIYDGLGGDEAAALPDENGSYSLARSDGIVIDAQCYSPLLILDQLLQKRSNWGHGHMAQHSSKPNTSYVSCDLSPCDALPYIFAPHGSRSAPIHDDDFSFLFTTAQDESSPLPSQASIPGAILVATKQINKGDEIFCNYRFSPFGKMKPSWAEFVLPSSEWDTYEGICESVGVSNVIKRPCNIDVLWNEEIYNLLIAG